MGHEKDLIELKQKLLELSEPELEEIKAKHKNEEKREEEINSIVLCYIEHDIFDKNLVDKELDIFIETYDYMMYYASAINGALTELYSKVLKK